ncbi:MAG TPA: Nramp family divalent metal transporter [Chloroflexota bacterium]|nr:Nramp family divalent metal transporter [Chloroflexota bacterium]
MAHQEDPGEVVRDLAEVTTESGALSGAPGTAVPRRAVPLWRRLLSPRVAGPWAILLALGPGLIAANAGNDAGGIATYATTGAQYGYSLLWVLPIITISLAVVQEMAARMGAVTGKGLSDLIRENLPLHMTALVMLALFISNGATVISEFVGIAASTSLIHPSAQYIAVPLTGLAIWLLVVRGSYSTVERVFLTMTLAFFAYPVSAILAHPNWGAALHNLEVPTFKMNYGYLVTIIALIGTTITPYMQVYVQSSVAEKGVTPRDYLPEKVGVYSGSVFAVAIAGFIVVATAATLFPHPAAITALDAAKALGPLAGQYAGLLFGIGLFGASVLAAAVLPLATAYSISEALGVEKGVDAGFGEAPVFMGIFTGLMAIGVLVALFVSQQVMIEVLILVQVINGLLLPVVLFTILRLVNDRRLMGEMVNGPIYNTIARITVVVVTIVSLTYLFATILQPFGINF